jgi:hypothetical protein
LGIGFAAAANRLLLRMISQGSDTVRLDLSANLRLLGFTLAVTVCTALLFGALPVLRATRLQLTDSLKAGRGASATGGRRPMAKVLVIAQVGLSLVLMADAGLFLRTLVNLNRVDAGFNKENVLRLNIDSAVLGYKDDDPRRNAVFQQIEDLINALPGEEAAGFSAFTFGEGSWNSQIRVPAMPINRQAKINHNIIGNGYFSAMQISLLAWRAFGPHDTRPRSRWPSSVSAWPALCFPPVRPSAAPFTSATMTAPAAPLTKWSSAWPAT